MDAVETPRDRPGMARPRNRGLLARFRAWRDAKLADPAFQSWAVANPFTRRVARRSAEQLFDLCAGFVYYKTLAACVELDLFERLAPGPLTAGEIAPALGMDPVNAERLMAAAASLDLLERRGGAYGLGRLGAALRGAEGVTDMVRHHALFYADLDDPVALLQGRAAPTWLAEYWAYAGAKRTTELSDRETAPYTGLMAASQAMIAEDVIAALPLRRHRLLMDVGGGSGRFLRAVAAAAPHLQLRLFDLPSVARQAETRFAEAGLSARVEAVGGDFFADPLPTGADAISLVRIVHDHDDGPALRLLRAARQALEPGGRLILAEPMAGVPGAGRSGDAYFGFYMLAMGAGRTRTEAELRGLLAEAGFAGIRRHRTRRPFLTGLLTARPG